MQTFDLTQMAVTRLGFPRLGLVVVLALTTGVAGCGSLVDRFSGRAEACQIIAIGKPARGTIVRLIDTGTTINKNPVVEFVIRVVPEVGDPFVANTKAMVSRLDIPAVQPGRVVPVRYDPVNPSRIALDLWDCSKP